VQAWRRGMPFQTVETGHQPENRTTGHEPVVTRAAASGQTHVWDF
jgi:hypothetical protein